MASPNLTAFNLWVDAFPITPAQRVTLKARVKALYGPIAKESIAHLRFHASAVIADVNSTTAARTRAQQILTLTDVIVARPDSEQWWLDVVGIP